MPLFFPTLGRVWFEDGMVYSGSRDPLNFVCHAVSFVKMATSVRAGDLVSPTDELVTQVELDPASGNVRLLLAQAYYTGTDVFPLRNGWPVWPWDALRIECPHWTEMSGSARLTVARLTPRPQAPMTDPEVWRRTVASAMSLAKGMGL